MTFLPSLEAAGLPTATATQPFAGTVLNSRGWLRRGSAIPCFHLRGGHRSPCHPKDVTDIKLLPRSKKTRNSA